MAHNQEAELRSAFETALHHPYPEDYPMVLEKL